MNMMLSIGRKMCCLQRETHHVYSYSSCMEAWSWKVETEPDSSVSSIYSVKAVQPVHIHEIKGRMIVEFKIPIFCIGANVRKGAAHYSSRFACVNTLRQFVMASGKRKMLAPSKAAKIVSQPKNLTADLVSLVEATSVALFTKEELDKFDVLETEPDFVVVRCGRTSQKFGDYVGRIKIFRDGTLRITCECFNDCTEDNMTPSEFQNHTKSPTGQSRYRTSPIWVFTKAGNRVPLCKTKLLKYNTGSPNDFCAKTNPPKKPAHRDEFITCATCNKGRRFDLPSREACKIYHDASLNVNWTCADYPKQRYSCEDDDERLAKVVHRGCRKKAACKGCQSCVCFGCSDCRFEDCNCRNCVDFISNNAGAKNDAKK